MTPDIRKMTVDSLHAKIIVAAFFVAFFMLGVFAGYGLSLVDQTSVAEANYELKARPRVLDLQEHASYQYVNPFELVNARTLRFPIDQLQGCRDWIECYQYCSQPTHFQVCSSWSRSQGLTGD